MNFISNIFGGGSKKVIDGDDNKNKKENLFSAENKEKINKLLITLEGIDKDKIKKVLLNKNTHDGLRAISPNKKEVEVDIKTDKIQTFISGLIKYIQKNNIPEIPVKSDGRKSRRSRRSKRTTRRSRRSRRSKRTTRRSRRSRRSKRSTRRSRRSKRSSRSKRSKRTIRRSKRSSRSKRSKRTTRRSKRTRRSIKHMKIRSSRKTKRM